MRRATLHRAPTQRERLAHALQEIDWPTIYAEGMPGAPPDEEEPGARRMPYVPGPGDDVPAPDELTCLILWHASPYPEDDPRRDWIAQALRQWAGEKGSQK